MIDAAISILLRRSKDTQYVVGGPGKRIFDLLTSFIMLLSLSPLILIVAILVKMADHGPVIFCHTRVGYDGRRFQCLKFRSIVTNADEVLRCLLDSDPESRQEWERTQKLAKDPRITPL